MQCPVDNSTLLLSERQGVEIDYCPQCRGVWLDRGELDKIIERSAAASPQPTSFVPPQPQGAPRPHYPEHRYDPRHGHDPRYHKRKSFLGELFDFD